MKSSSIIKTKKSQQQRISPTTQHQQQQPTNLLAAVNNPYSLYSFNYTTSSNLLTFIPNLPSITPVSLPTPLQPPQSQDSSYGRQQRQQQQQQQRIFNNHQQQQQLLRYEYENLNKKTNGKRSNSIMSENHVNYDDESYMRFNDISSFKLKTFVYNEHDIVRTKKSSTAQTPSKLGNHTANGRVSKTKKVSASHYYETKHHNGELSDKDSIKIDNTLNNEEIYSKLEDDNLKQKKFNENKLNNLKYFYTKVRYLNRKHSERRKNENKMSRKRINDIELNKNLELVETNLNKSRLSTESEQQQQQQQHAKANDEEECIFNENEDYREFENNLNDNDVGVDDDNDNDGDDSDDEEYEANEVDDEEVEEEEEEGDDEEIYNNEDNEEIEEEINESDRFEELPKNTNNDEAHEVDDPDQYYYNVDIYDQNDNTKNVIENINNSNTNTKTVVASNDSLIDVKTLKKYFEMTETVGDDDVNDSRIATTTTSTTAKPAPTSNTIQTAKSYDGLKKRQYTKFDELKFNSNYKSKSQFNLKTQLQSVQSAPTAYVMNTLTSVTHNYPIEETNSKDNGDLVYDLNYFNSQKHLVKQHQKNQTNSNTIAATTTTTTTITKTTASSLVVHNPLLKSLNYINPPNTVNNSINLSQQSNKKPQNENASAYITYQNDKANSIKSSESTKANTSLVSTSSKKSKNLESLESKSIKSNKSGGTNASILLSNLIKLRLSQYANQKQPPQHISHSQIQNELKTKLENKIKNLTAQSIFLIPEFNFHNQTLRIRGIGGATLKKQQQPQQQQQQQQQQKEKLETESTPKAKLNLKLPKLITSRTKKFNGIYTDSQIMNSNANNNQNYSNNPLIIAKSIDTHNRNLNNIKLAAANRVYKNGSTSSSRNSLNGYNSKQRSNFIKMVDNKHFNNNNSNNNRRSESEPLTITNLNEEAKEQQQQQQIQLQTSVSLSDDEVTLTNNETNILKEEKPPQKQIEDDEKLKQLDESKEIDDEPSQLHSTNQLHLSFTDNDILSKSVGDYKYIATTTSRLKPRNTSQSPTITSLSSTYHQRTFINETNNLPDILLNKTNTQLSIQPKFSNNNNKTFANPALPPIKINLHVNNEYNYKNFERINRNF